MIRFLSSIMDRVFVIMGALFGAQIPEFLQQYRQRLAGHVAELNRVLDGLRQLAKQSNKNLEEYIGKFMTNSDLDFARQGTFMQEMGDRWERLNEALVSLTSSSAWERPYVFLRDLQYEIARSTFHDFQPGVNMTPEGIGYMVLGAVLGYGAYQLIAKTIGFCWQLTIAKNGGRSGLCRRSGLGGQ